MRLVIFGATGFAGSRIAAESLRRGHEVVAVARNIDSAETDLGAAERVSGSLHDAELVDTLAADADVVVSAVPARPLQDGLRLVDAVPNLVAAARRNRVRIGVVGGAGSLLVSENGPQLIDTPEFPEEYKPEAAGQGEVLDALRATPQDIDWFYLSPAAAFGAAVPGTRTGTFRLGTDVLLSDDSGHSTIGGEDYAIAFVDEIDNPAHPRARFTVAY